MRRVDPKKPVSGLVLLVLVISSGPSSAKAPATTVPERAPRTARLAFTGDIIPHERAVRFARYYARATHYEGKAVPPLRAPAMYQPREPPTVRDYDFRPLFQPAVAGLRAADLAICHLETTISTEPPHGFPRLRAPPELVEAIAESGWDGCSLASNHAFDYGVEGVARTIEAMLDNGLGFAGAAVDRQSETAAVYIAGGIRIAHLSYTYGLNGFRLPDDEEWRVNLIDIETISRHATEAREEGAEFVVASLHWGTEYERTPNAYQRRIARELAGTGMVDLLVGHHAHVIQPVDRIGEMWVAYGLGNFLTNQSRESTRDGAILHVRIGDDPQGSVAVEDITYTPTWVDRRGMRVVTVANRLADPHLDHFLRNTLLDSWDRTVEAFGAMGAANHGLRPRERLP